jgi:cell division protein FtsA
LYATAVGLVLDGLHRQDKQQPVAESSPDSDKKSPEIPKDPLPVRSKGFLEKLTERVKEFLENAE